MAVTDQGPGWAPFGQTGISFDQLISTLLATNQNTAALLAGIESAVQSLPVNIAPAYTTGSWTPADASGAALVFTGVSANYTGVGRLIYAYATFTYPVTADVSAAAISGLPVASANAGFARGPAKCFTSAAVNLIIRPRLNSSTADFLDGGTGGTVTNATLSGATVSFMLPYPTS